MYSLLVICRRIVPQASMRTTKKKEKKTSCWWMNDYIHISIVEEANRNSRRVHRHTHTCTWGIIIRFDWLKRACISRRKREEFNLVEWREKEERTSFNCSSRPRTYMRRVCVCMSVSSAAFVCWFVPMIELDRRHFLLL